MSRNALAAIGFDGALTLIALAVLLGAGFHLTATLLLALALSIWLIRNLGQAIVPRADANRVITQSASFVIGFAMLSMAMMAIVTIFPVTAFTALLCCIPVIAIFWFYRRGQRLVEASHPWFEPATILVLGATVAWFCRVQISAYLSLLESGGFHPWDDFFVHGAQVAQFGDPLAIGRGDILEAGRPLAFYHYGMYILPAALLAVPNAPPGLAIATSGVLVYGLLVAMLGCFALAAELGGALAALLAVASVMLLPDAASLWPGNGSFGYHWLMMVAPGSGYAIGVSAVALLYLCYWQQERRWTDALVCVLLVGSVALLRAQIFAVLAPACVLTVVYTRFSAYAKQITAGLSALMLLLAAGTIFVDPLRHWFEARARFSEFIANEYLPLPDANSPLYAHLVQLTGPEFASWIGLVLLPVQMLGAWSVFSLVSFFSLRAEKQLSRQDLIPLMLLVVYLALVVFAPTPSNGDFTEFKQRPFVFIYTIFLLWPIARLLGTIKLDGRVRSRQAFAGAAAAIFLFIGVLTLLLQNQDPQANPAAWTKTHIDSQQPAGLGEAAAYVRAHAQKGDVMVSIGSCEEHSVPLASMTDMPQYFAQGGVQWSRRDRGSADLDPHVQVLRKLESSHSAEEAAQVLTAAGIRWLVVIEPDAGCERRAPEIGTPLFQSHRVAVFAAPHRT